MTTKLNTQSLPPLSGKKATSVVVLLHGVGSNGADMAGLAEFWRRSLPDTAFIAPDAPEAYDMAPMGHQWFSLQERTDAALAAGVKKTAPLLDAFLDDVLKTYELPASKLALVGFSQGTMMSLYVGPRRSQQIAGILGYSGLMVTPEALVKEKKSTPPVLLIHGTSDDVVPFAQNARSEAALKAAGLSVTAIPCPGTGHAIDEAGVRAGLNFLHRVLQVD